MTAVGAAYGAAPESAKGRYSPAECIGTIKTRVSGEPDMAHVSMSYAAIAMARSPIACRSCQGKRWTRGSICRLIHSRNRPSTGRLRGGLSSL